ncbi:MAG: TIM barrel protein [Verrucomicrobia bacterium]|nr:TIM barrel protein [Verrucomicrobiota bacterium]
MVEEMVGLGFKRIELSHGIRISLVPGILKAVEEKLVEVGSVHNFCPIPPSAWQAAPNLFEPASTDKQERELWKRYTERTLDFAVKVGAPKVVMHSGSAWFFFGSPEAKFEKWLSAQKREAIEAVSAEHAEVDEAIEVNEFELETKLYASEAFKKQRDRILPRIKRASKKPLRYLNESYATILPYAKERGLQLGLENREGLEELPLDRAYPDFMEKLEDAETFGYWHDTGHAQLKHRLGLLDHRAHLEAMAPRLIGFHLHDVSEGGRDHRVPGTGTIDFDMVAEFVRPEHTLVLELSPSLSRDQVRASRDYLLETLT